MVKRAGNCARNLSASARFLSTLIATMARPAPPYLSCIAFIHGNDIRQGPHHDAQKSRYTVLPRSADNWIGVLSACVTVMSGAWSPTASAWEGRGKANETAASAISE